VRPEEPPRDQVDRAAVPRDDRVEGLAVAGPVPLDELGVGCGLLGFQGRVSTDRLDPGRREKV